MRNGFGVAAVLFTNAASAFDLTQEVFLAGQKVGTSTVKMEATATNASTVELEASL